MVSLSPRYTIEGTGKQHRIMDHIFGTDNSYDAEGKEVASGLTAAEAQVEWEKRTREDTPRVQAQLLEMYRANGMISKEAG